MKFQLGATVHVYLALTSIDWIPQRRATLLSLKTNLLSANLKQLIMSWGGKILLILGLTAELLAQPLDIYFIDVEGGAATLIVTPQQETILIDTGWRRDDNRDAKRIHQIVSTRTGLKQIDHLVTTHFHRDHYGGIQRLSEMVPILNFFDHGPMNDVPEDPQFASAYVAYMRANKGQRQKLSPGDQIPLKKSKVPLQVLCIASNGETLQGTNAPPNPECKNSPRRETDSSDNANSVALLLRFGQFEFLDCGDLTWNVEAKLACPANVIGKVDLYQVTHHGLKSSNHSALVRGVEPTVAVINNGPRKGGDPEVFSLLKSTPSIKDIFQVHRNLKTGPKDNAPPDFIANLGGEDGCPGRWVHVSVNPDASSFSVTNSRNNLTRSYTVK